MALKTKFQQHWSAVGTAEMLGYFQFEELLSRLTLISQEEERHDEGERCGGC